MISMNHKRNLGYLFFAIAMLFVWLEFFSATHNLSGIFWTLIGDNWVFGLLLLLGAFYVITGEGE